MKAECAYTVPRELVSKNAILLWRFHHTLFSVTLCLLVATEKLPARAVWRTICRSYLLTTCQSIVTIYFMNCCDWFSQIYQKRHRNILKTECNFIYWYLCSYLCSLFKIPWLKLELENHIQELRNANVLSMRLLIRKRNEEKSNSCQRSKLRNKWLP